MRQIKLSIFEISGTAVEVVAVEVVAVVVVAETVKWVFVG
jgi:hypothetical protein